MSDLEKTIKGLECHSEPKCGPDEFFCELCPYDECTCGLDVPYDALKLLKAQQPRLLTLDELLNAKNIDVYLEETCETQMHPLRLVETENESRNQAAFFWPSVVRPLKSYGKTWRCWTFRPTDEQREAAPWKE